MGSNRAAFCSPRCHLKGRGEAQENGCILWMGPVGNHGYGNFHYNKTLYLTHRAAYEIFKGPIPDGMMVCHTCDVKICINPEHLFLGTSFDNMADMARKGRQSRKLTDEDVRQIRSIVGVSYAQIGRLYGVTEVMARNIRLGKWWRHLPDA